MKFFETSLYRLFCIPAGLGQHSGTIQRNILFSDVVTRLNLSAFLIRTSAPHTLSSVVDILGSLFRCLSSIFMFQFSKALQQTHNCSRDTTRAPYTSTNWRWIFTGTTPFTRKNLITQRTWTFDDVAVGLPSLNWLYGDMTRFRTTQICTYPLHG
jgi:hypothetical protein